MPKETKEFSVQEQFRDCRSTRRWLIGLAVSLGVTIGGGLLSLSIRTTSNTEYIKGQVDLLVDQNRPAPRAAGPAPLARQTQETP